MKHLIPHLQSARRTMAWITAGGLALGVLLALPPVLGAQLQSGAGKPEQINEAPRLQPGFLIDGTPVSLADFDDWLVGAHGETMVEEYVNEWAVERAAERAGVVVTPEEVRAVIESEIEARVQGAFRGNRDAWREELVRGGRSEAGYMRAREISVRQQLLAVALARQNRVVPEELIQREWQLRYGPAGKSWELRLLKLDLRIPSAPAGSTPAAQEELRLAAETEVRDKALALRARALSGESFASLVREYSTDTATKLNGGAPRGKFDPTGWGASFLQALDSQTPGTLSEPLQARGGFWLVMLDRVTITPLESVRAALDAELLLRGPESSEVADCHQLLMQGLEVEILPALWSFRWGGQAFALGDKVLRIDDGYIQRGTFERWARHTTGESLVRRYAFEWLVQQEAQRRGYSVEATQLEQRTDDYLARQIEVEYQGDKQAFLKDLGNYNRTEESYRREVRARLMSDLLAERIVQDGRVIGEDRLRSAWEQQYGPGGTAIEVRMILLNPVLEQAPPADATADDLEKLLKEIVARRGELATELVRKVRAGEDFADLARKHSDDERTRELGGKQSGVYQTSGKPDAINAAVLALEPGKCTDPLRWGNQWLIFEALSRRSTSYEQARPLLLQQLLAERAIENELAELQNKLLTPAKIEILPAFFE